MAENKVRSDEYRELPEHTSHREHGPLNPDIAMFRESAVTAAEENVFQGTVPPGEEENPFTAARKKPRKKRKFFMRGLLGGAVRAGAAAFGLLLVVGLIILLNRDSADSETALKAKEILEDAQRPLQTVHDDYGPGEIGGVWNGDPAAPHKYDMEHPVIAKEASCTEEGEIRFICAECGVILKEALPANGHSPAEAVTENEIAGSCLEQGKADEVVYCSVCGEELSRTEVARAIGPHTPEDPVEENRTEASCTEDGSFDTVVYCSVCGGELSRETTVLKASGHSEGEAVEENRADASCTEDGSYDSVVYCEVCGEELSRETVVLEALGHDYEDRTVAATCTAQGYTVHTCSRCNDSYSDTYTAALGHSYTARVTAATCTAQGYTTHTCSRCGNSYRDTYTAALGHNFNNATSSACVRGCGTRAVTISYNASVRGFNYSINNAFIAEVQRLGIYINGMTVIDLADNSSFNSIEYDAGVTTGTINPASYAAVSNHQYELRLHCGTSTVIYSNRITVP